MRAPLRSGLLILSVAALTLAPRAHADAAVSLAVPPGSGQQALALRVEAGGVRVHACAAAPCAPEGGTLVPAPEGSRARFEQAHAAAITLDAGRALARVNVPGEAEGSSWVLLVAAPLAGKPGEPVVLWSGWTGVPRGELGEEHAPAVRVERSPKGAARVLVGEEHADVTVCGRPALVGVHAVDPATLALVRGAASQSLGDEERGRAVKLTAERARGEAVPAGGPAVLHAKVASSAYQSKLGALTDGEAATAWSENKPGDGRGEFVSMNAPEEVGIDALDLVVRPTEDVPEGAAPKRFYLATTGALFEVTMPEDAYRQPAGARYTVKLPAPLHTSCLALVLDDAYAHGPDPRVTVAELTARTAFDGQKPEALAGALAGGGERARAAAALLVRSGAAGPAAAIAAYDKLDEAGQRLAAGVVDAAPCKDQVPFFAARFAAASEAAGRAKAAPGEVDPELAHARDRLRRCGHASALALAAMVAKGGPHARALAAEELALLAPAEAVPVLLDALSTADDPTRRDLRAALARAARSQRSFEVLHDELARDKLAARSETVAIDLLRAAGPSLPRVEGAAASFADLAARATSFRARFLLQAPAAELALAGDAAALAYVRDALRKDPDAHVRARAAEVAGRILPLAPDLAAAFADADPRVREAAVNTVADAAAAAAGTAAPPVPAAELRERLAKDDWTFVRAGAAHTLGALPAGPDTDRALAAALADGSPEVRARALDGLGAHGARDHADAVRARQDDQAETLDVRARAILALGALCDARSVDAWTKLARGAKTPVDDKDRRLGASAVEALGALHPADLAARLAPLLEKDAPPGVRELAQAALAAHGACLR